MTRHASNTPAQQTPERRAQSSAQSATPAGGMAVPGPVQTFQRMADDSPRVQRFGQLAQLMNGAPVQRSYKVGDKEWKEEDRTFKKEDHDQEGDAGKFTAVKADSGLPTPYGMLKGIFGSNLNDNAFGATKGALGSTCDRPHQVKAEITAPENRDQRGNEDNDMVTAIGHLGAEEFHVRDGASDDRAQYNGGHLVGYQVMGGGQSNSAWNVAPQDGDNNKFAYNNTIERMMRDAETGTRYSLDVSLSYKSLNYRVNQQMLFENGVLKGLDDSKVWELQLPARIPQLWEATATIAGKGQFAKPSAGEGKSYDQLSQDLTSPLDEYDPTHSARYKLEYWDDSDTPIKHAVAKNDTSEVEKVKFTMHQAQPPDLDTEPPPKDWGGPAVADFGDVKIDALTVSKVKALLADLLKIYDELEKEAKQQVEDYEVDYFKGEGIETKPEPFDFAKELARFGFGADGDTKALTLQRNRAEALLEIYTKEKCAQYVANLPNDDTVDWKELQEKVEAEILLVTKGDFDIQDDTGVENSEQGANLKKRKREIETFEGHGVQCLQTLRASKSRKINIVDFQKKFRVNCEYIFSNPKNYNIARKFHDMTDVRGVPKAGDMKLFQERFLARFEAGK